MYVSGIITFSRALVRGEQVEALEDEADLAVADRARARRSESRETSWPSSQYSPDGRAVEAAEDVHQRALARAAGAHQRDELAALDRQRDALEHGHVDLAEVVGLGDVVEPDQVHRVESLE